MSESNPPLPRAAAATSVPTTTPSPHQAPPPDPDEPYVLSYFALRRAAGWIGLALPVVVCIFNRQCLPDSISGSYYTGVRNYFVGSLCAVGIFLLCSIGYKRDTKYSIFAGVMAILVAFNPCRTPDPCADCGIPTPLPYFYSPQVHAIAASLLFLTFAFFCLVLFTRSANNKNGFMPRIKGLPPKKRQRNMVFILCGTVMLVAMATLAVDAALKLHIPYITLIVESVCLWAFGWAWLVKGQQLLPDPPASPQ